MVLRKNVITKIVSLSIFAVLSASLAAAEHLEKNIAVIQSPDNRACFFFTLQGVDVADPDVIIGANVTPEWFSVDMNHKGYDDIFALLLAAKLSNKAVTVRTSGVSACELAAVEFVQIN